MRFYKFIYFFAVSQNLKPLWEIESKGIKNLPVILGNRIPHSFNVFPANPATSACKFKNEKNQSKDKYQSATTRAKFTTWITKLLSIEPQLTPRLNPMTWMFSSGTPDFIKNFKNLATYLPIRGQFETELAYLNWTFEIDENSEIWRSSPWKRSNWAPVNKNHRVITNR